MKVLSLSAEALWGLKDFLRVVSGQDLTAAFPELGVKSSIRSEHIRESIVGVYEATDHYKELQSVQQALEAYRAELLKPYEGQTVPTETNKELGKKLQEKAVELTSGIPQDNADKQYILELSDEKAEQLVKTYEQFGAKYLLDKRIVLRIAKELGIEE